MSADALADPGAVVVHVLDAALAGVAVEGPLGHVDLALFAEPVGGRAAGTDVAGVQHGRQEVGDQLRAVYGQGQQHKARKLVLPREVEQRHGHPREEQERGDEERPW